MLLERWLPWKAGLYGLEVVSPQGRCFRAGGLVYDNLSQFDFTLKHVLGTRMRKANGLSGRLDWKIGVDKDNENQVFIKDNWVCNLQEVVIKGPEVELLEKIKKARSKDEDVVKVVEEMKKTKIKEL